MLTQLPEKCLYSWKLVNTCLNVHPQDCISGLTPTTLLLPASTNGTPQQSPCSSGWMRTVGSGVRRLQPDLHLNRTRELLHCPQEGRDGVMPIILMWLRLSVPWSGAGGDFRERSAVLLAPWRGSDWCSCLVGHL